MIVFGTVLAICCLNAVKAVPSQWGSSNQIQLEGSPDIETYGKISYPKYDLLDLGEYSKGHLPSDEIKVTKESKITIPQPYPVKIPVPHPYPVHVDKPYPVHETKIVKVPVPYPQIIEKKVPYPVEVPKPFPVPVESHHQQENHGGAENFEHALPEGGSFGGGAYGGHQALESNGYGVQENHNDLPSNEGQEAGIGGGNFNHYESQALENDYSASSNGAENGGWQPINGDENEGQYH